MFVRVELSKYVTNINTNPGRAVPPSTHVPLPRGMMYAMYVSVTCRYMRVMCGACTSTMSPCTPLMSVSAVSSNAPMPVQFTITSH